MGRIKVQVSRSQKEIPIFFTNSVTNYNNCIDSNVFITNIYYNILWHCYITKSLLQYVFRIKNLKTVKNIVYFLTLVQKVYYYNEIRYKIVFNFVQFVFVLSPRKFVLLSWNFSYQVRTVHIPFGKCLHGRGATVNLRFPCSGLTQRHQLIRFVIGPVCLRVI